MIFRGILENGFKGRLGTLEYLINGKIYSYSMRRKHIISVMYDADKKVMTAEFGSSMLEGNIDLLEDAAKNSELANCKVRVEESNLVYITFSLDLPEKYKYKDSLPDHVRMGIDRLIQDFTNRVMKRKLSKSEFIPLYGYSVENLQKDIVEAIRNKRDFVVMDKYSEYVKFTKRDTETLNQFRVSYGSNEYSDVAIYIHSGNMKKLREIWLPKLERQEWI